MFKSLTKLTHRVSFRAHYARSARGETKPTGPAQPVDTLDAMTATANLQGMPRDLTKMIGEHLEPKDYASVRYTSRQMARNLKEIPELKLRQEFYDENILSSKKKDKPKKALENL